jgi:hypothetical protein
LERLKIIIIRLNSTSDHQDLFVRCLVVGSLNIKGSTISHMAAVYPGHYYRELTERRRK